jgi:CRP-like cAMP-binding protein
VRKHLTINCDNADISHKQNKMTKEQNIIINHFERYIKVSENLKSQLIKRLSPINFKKGELVLNAGYVCTKSYFICEGVLRAYTLKDGREISEFFCAKNEWANSPKSFIQRTPDIYYIDAIVDTSAFALNVNDLGYLFDNFPEMERYARLSMGTVFGLLMERITSMRFTSAKEKYLHFKKIYEDIYPQIPLGMVASYLGITQETLSRIRAEK